jgi:hypothetical protein
MTRYRVTAPYVTVKVNTPSLTTTNPVTVHGMYRDRILSDDVTDQCVKDLLASGMIEEIEDL